ncbi:MAG: hypothetical protein ACR2G7_13900, partial [Acidimicrobiales bacterium]
MTRPIPQGEVESRESTGGRRAASGAINFHHPAAFWLGTGAITTGVLLHLPMYVGARDMGYRLAGVAVDGPMVAGMALIMAGLGATCYGLFPPL